MFDYLGGGYYELEYLGGGYWVDVFGGGYLEPLLFYLYLIGISSSSWLYLCTVFDSSTWYCRCICWLLLVLYYLVGDFFVKYSLKITKLLT